MTVEQVIRAAVARCNRIVSGYVELQPFLEPVMPLPDRGGTDLPVIERMASVALLKRYEQLQDMLGRLFRAYLSWEAEDVRVMTRRDQANQLEKFQIVSDADDWIAAAELRNRLVHEYPTDEVEQVLRVNECWAAFPRLVGTYDNLREHLKERGVL